jgi:hypothetical protein
MAPAHTRAGSLAEQFFICATGQKFFRRAQRAADCKDRFQPARSGTKLPLLTVGIQPLGGFWHADCDGWGSSFQEVPP